MSDVCVIPIGVFFFGGGGANAGSVCFYREHRGLGVCKSLLLLFLFLPAAKPRSSNGQSCFPLSSSSSSSLQLLSKHS